MRYFPVTLCELTDLHSRFTREWIAKRNDKLDISWLKDDSKDATDNLPKTLAKEALSELEAAMAEIHSILLELGDEVGNE